MSISDLPALSVLRTKMQWHQERQSVLSQNVANSDTPDFKPRDTVPVPGRKPVFAVAFAPDGTQVFAGCGDRKIHRVEE